MLLLALGAPAAGLVVGNLTAGSPTMAAASVAVLESVLVVSVLVHEVGHALSARTQGLQVTGIHLSLTGGFASLAEPPLEARSAFRFTLGGPAFTGVLISLLAAFGTLALGWTWHDATGGLLDLPPDPLDAATRGALFVNLVLLVSNLWPSLRTDGGNLLAAALWRARGDETAARHVGATVAIGADVVALVLAVFLVKSGWHFVGFVVATVAAPDLLHARKARRGFGVLRQVARHTVRDAATWNIPTLPTLTSADHAWIEVFAKRPQLPFVAVTGSDGRFEGIARRLDIATASRRGSDLGEVVRSSASDSRIQVVPATMPLVEAMAAEVLGRDGALAVVDEGRLVGVADADSILRTISVGG